MPPLPTSGSCELRPLQTQVFVNYKTQLQEMSQDQG